VAADIARYFGASLRAAPQPPASSAPDAILDIVREQRQKLVVGVDASGQVRESQLRLWSPFGCARPDGARSSATEIEQRREIELQ